MLQQEKELESNVTSRCY